MQIKFYQRAIRARPHDADMYFNYALFLEEVERRYGWAGGVSGGMSVAGGMCVCLI